MVGRESGQIRLTVCIDTKQDTIAPKIRECTVAHVTLYTDEASAYAPVAEGEDNRRTRYAVCHSDGEWAVDCDGDGIREVHCNTMEGIWTGLRNFLRTFRGVHKKYLAQYVAMFELAHNLKQVTNEYLRLLMLPDYTFNPT